MTDAFPGGGDVTNGIGGTPLVSLDRLAAPAAELGPDRSVTTLARDSGLKCLSTELYSSADRGV